MIMQPKITTGSSGFLGKHLIKKLGGTNEIKHGHIKSEYFENGSTVYFLSTYGNMAHHADHYEMVKANVIDLLSVLKVYQGTLIYMSSSSVMLDVQTPYSRTKRAAEEILLALPEVKSAIVRPFSVTGVGEQEEHLIPTLIRSCITGEEMPFDPFPVHDFVDVEDVVDGLITLADGKVTGIHEFGRGFGYTNEAVLDIVEEVTGKKANITVKSGIRAYDSPLWYCKNPSPFFKPKKTLYESIKEMVNAQVS